jgi:hypothetical protein
MEYPTQGLAAPIVEGNRFFVHEDVLEERYPKS